jgi:hypothetical protein
MSFLKSGRKFILGLFAIAAISYGLKLQAQQQSQGLTPPPKPTTAPSAATPGSARSNGSNAPNTNAPNNGSPFVVGERLIYNISWASFPSAARIELEVAGQGQFYGQDSYQLRSKVETLGQVRSLFGDVDNQYTSYVNLSTATPHRVVNTIHQGQTQSEEVTILDQSKQKASFSDDVTVSIPGGTYDLTSLVYALRLRPLVDGSKYKFNALYGKELIELEAVVKGRERLVSQTGSYNTILVKFYPKGGKYGDYRGYVYLTDDSQRLPVMLKAKLPVGEARAELTSVTIATRLATPLTRLNPPPTDEDGSMSGLNPGAASGAPKNGYKLVMGSDDGNGENGNPEPGTERNFPFVVGERLNYDISWGNFTSVGKASFEVRQMGMLGKKRVFEFFGEASSIGAARNLINVNDQFSSFALADSLSPVRTDIRLREGKRSKQTTATFDWSKNQMSLSSGGQTNVQPGAYDLVSLFYGIRAAELKIGSKRDFIFLDANNRLQMVAIKVVKQESIGGPLGTRDALQVDVLAPEPAKLLLGQVWISNDARRLPLYFVTRTRFGEIRFQMTNAVNTK